MSVVDSYAFLLYSRLARAETQVACFRVNCQYQKHCKTPQILWAQSGLPCTKVWFHNLDNFMSKAIFTRKKKPFRYFFYLFLLKSCRRSLWKSSMSPMRTAPVGKSTTIQVLRFDERRINTWTETACVESLETNAADSGKEAERQRMVQSSAASEKAVRWPMLSQYISKLSFWSRRLQQLHSVWGTIWKFVH